MTLTGKGQQRFLTKKFLDKRRRGLLDDEHIDKSLHEWYGISGNAGGGKTDPDMHERKQNPYPVERGKKKTIDIRDLPWIG